MVTKPKQCVRVSKYTRDEVILQVQNLAEELGKTPTQIEFLKNPFTASIAVVVALFGSWVQFLIEAGLNPDHRYTKSELIAQVQKLAKERDRTPTTADFNEDRRVASVATIRKLFGSWNQFLKEAGLKPNKVFPSKR